MKMLESKVGLRADRILAMTAATAAAATGSGLVGDATEAQADIVYRGVVNINIPSNIDGVYLNVVTGTTGSLGGSVAGWDINPYSGTTMNFFSPDSANTGGFVRAGGSSTTLTDNLAPGFLIDANANTGGTWGNSAAESTGATAFNLNSSDNIVGFRFVNEANGNQVHFGWMRISLAESFTAQPRTLVEYAYESNAGVGIQAGAVPEPTSLSILALGALGLVARRRRRSM